MCSSRSIWISCLFWLPGFSLLKLSCFNNQYEESYLKHSNLESFCFTGFRSENALGHKGLVLKVLRRGILCYEVWISQGNTSYISPWSIYTSPGNHFLNRWPVACQEPVTEPCGLPTLHKRMKHWLICGEFLGYPPLEKVWSKVKWYGCVKFNSRISVQNRSRSSLCVKQNSTVCFCLAIY